MATAQMKTVMRHFRRAMLLQDGASRTDGQLLASFIEQKDEAAFEALVRRHGPMVFGVWLLRITRHEALRLGRRRGEAHSLAFASGLGAVEPDPIGQLWLAPREKKCIKLALAGQ